MVFGEKNIYAIEVYHEPQYNTSYYMSGRMCLHLNGIMFGDIDDPCNVLGVTYANLLQVVENIDEIRDDFNSKTDTEIFNALDAMLYDAMLYINDEEKSYEQMMADGKKYWKFDFLTNGGVMFDRTKSFIYLDDFETIHILYQFEDRQIHSAQVSKDIFLEVTNKFLEWFDKTEKIHTE